MLLIYGGSKGARSINRVVLDALPRLLSRAIVVHVSGERDWAELEAARNRLAAPERARYRAHAYLHEEMVDAMAAADLVVCRSSAPVRSETAGAWAACDPVALSARLAISQRVNADYLAARGAAEVLEDGALGDPERGLAARAIQLLDDAPALEAMRLASRRLARLDGADNIAVLLAKAAERTHD